MKTHLHSSYLLAGLAFGVCLGLVFAKYLNLSVGLIACILALFLVLSALRAANILSLVLIIFAGILIGGYRGASFLASLQPYQSLHGQTVTAEAKTAEDPEPRNNNLNALRLGDITIGQQQLPGQIYATASSDKPLKRGDNITFKAEFNQGFGKFQAVARRIDVLKISRGNDFIRDTREAFASGVRRVAPADEAALGLGFVVGQRSQLPKNLDESLRVVGLTHIVVASGYNLTILVRFARRLFVRWSRFLASSISALLMFSFTLFSGFSASMNRAVVVTGLSLLAWHYGRRFHPLHLLLYVAAATALWNPVYIWQDLGWYLSFLAFAGVLILAPMLAKFILHGRKPSALVQVVFETIAAQLMTLPLILLTFGQLPTLSVIANALVAPIIPVSMLLTTIAGLIGMFLPVLTVVGGLIMHFSVGYVLVIVNWLSAVPGAQASVSLSLFNLAIIYSALVTFIFLLWRVTKHDFREQSVVE